MTATSHQHDALTRRPRRPRAINRVRVARLRGGCYRLSAVATDAAGDRSAPLRKRVRVKARAR
jgi:hypothetical protein